MKGNKLSVKDLRDGQIVYVEFSFYGLSYEGETEEEFEEKVDRLREGYPDKVYKVNLNDKSFVDIETGDGLYFYHNLIDEIYEWNE